MLLGIVAKCRLLGIVATIGYFSSLMRGREEGEREKELIIMESQGAVALVDDA